MYTANRQAVDARGMDFIAMQAHARALRAEAIAALIGRGLSTAARALRTAWHALEQNRLDRALRRELSRLDAHTLRDLGLSPAALSSMSSEALLDHPLAVPEGTAARHATRAANENATGAGQGARTAA